ncbi:MAG: restriction endonuclease [Methanothermobacter sp.]|nr:restriction endonuclease [Methanothermobacter tenebrarum]MDD3454617.1 restriction endonuclease [Methanobacteriales archaeon]MDI6882615.1 restriction endonuclease [Methanothermobacter sp.]MDX9693885.1 restriction endonuclease [Methanothermobacter sp.]HOQ20611.1 restriction endonuclease [Methanothermobacter sp.]
MGDLKREKLVNFMAKIMEESGFKVYKNFKTSKYVVDIYGIIPTAIGDMSVVVACKNYDKKWKVGLDVLKEMEMVAKNLKASKIVIVTTSDYTKQALNYAAKKNIKLIDRAGIISLAEKFSKRLQAPEEEFHDEIESYTPKESAFNNAKRSLLSRKEPKTSIFKQSRILFQNLFFLVLLVVGISIGLTHLIETFIRLDERILGILKIFFSFILSYGITPIGEKEKMFILLRGTVVFFISLLILIIIILI